MRLRSLSSPAALLALFAVLWACAFASPVWAGWVPIGPEGGSILALAIDPSTPAIVYAGSDGGGAWKSFDAGASWVWAGLGAGNLQVSALAMAPSTPETLSAATPARA